MLFTVFRTRGIQPRGDGKILRAPSSVGVGGEVGVSTWGLGDFALGGRLEPAFGENRSRVFSSWSVQPKGPVHWHWSVLNSLHACA